GLAGWTVRLLDGSNRVVTTATTTSAGAYAFPGLGPGKYTIQLVQQSGYAATTAASTTLTALSGQDVPKLNIGVFQLVALSGEVYADINGDGVLGGGEAGLSGWTVDLLDDSNQTVATTTTDTAGHYAFGDVGAGTYTIQVVEPSGYVVSSAARRVATASGQD